MENYKKGRGLRGFWRHFCFAAFGISALIDIANPSNVVNLIFGAVVGVLFGVICHAFLSGIIGSMNGDVKKEYGKQSISYAVSKGMTYLVPFAIMAAVATFLLGWSVPGGFLAAGLMTAGATSSMEIDKISGKTSIKNSIASSVVCGLFAATWMIGIQFAGMVPPYVEGGIQLLGSLMGNPLK